MAKKTLLLIALFCSLNQFAQVNLNDYNTIFFQEVTFENEDYKLFLVRCFAKKEVVKIKLRIFNKTKDVLLIKPEEMEFVVNDKTLKGKGRTLTVQPNDVEDRLIDAEDNGANMKCETFDINLKGFYKVSYEGEVYVAQNTSLPDKKGSEVIAGPVKCSLLDVKMARDKSYAKYSCSYTGDKIGILEPSKCVAIMPNGQENLCTIKKDLFLVANGESHNITIEFKQVNGAGELTEGVQVKWNDALRSSSAVALKSIKVPMKIDLEKSEK